MKAARIIKRVAALLLLPVTGSGALLAQQLPPTPFLAVEEEILSWSGVFGATGYDLLRGDLATLRETGGDFTAASRVCLADDWSTSGFAYSGVPAPGEAFWFLVRAHVGTEPGTYDSGGAGQAGSRDAEIEAAPSSCLSPVVSRAPIDINTDSGFTAANGVVGGSGTPDDPYRIEGWNITCPSGGFTTGINLWSTAQPFVIRNVLLQGCTWGIKSYSAPGGRVEKNRFLGGNNGISMDASDDLTIVGNRVFQGFSTGIGVSRSANVQVRANTIERRFAGIYFDSNSGSSVSGNDVITNTLQANDQPGGVNVWDDGYPFGGNYWTNYQGMDQCRGPAQDDCSAPDGLGDTPYVLNALTTDRYPRMVPAFAEGDGVSPTVAIGSPAEGSVFMTLPITVGGTAADDLSGLRRVEVRLNGGSWTIAEGTAAWSLSVDLTPGANTIKARSLDHAGNVSGVDSIAVTYDAPGWEATIATNKQVYAPGEAVAITFSLTNRSAFPVTLHFRTDCQAAFRVMTDTGGAVYDAGNHMTCLFILTQRTWQPNETFVYNFNWTQKDDVGQQVPHPAVYRIQGYMLSDEPVPEPQRSIDIEP